jgi:hypothetical protein
MSASLTPHQTMLLWTLLAEGGEAWQQDIRPPVDAKVRAALQQARLVETRMQKNARNKRALLVSVTDAGWAYANEHLGAPLPDKVQGAAPVLQKWLARLQGFMHQRGVTLADIFAPPAPAASGPMVSTTSASGPAAPVPAALVPAAPGPEAPRTASSGQSGSTLQARIRSAYLRASGGALSQRVHLHALRGMLNDVDRKTLDDTLVEMMRHNELMLYGLDYRADITADDRRAAVTVGGDSKHILTMDR